MKNSEFIKYLSDLNITPTEEMLNKLEIYYNELVLYNSHTNLTSIVDKESVYLKHFYDSLTITKAYDFNKELKVLDIGTGAGFPGLVLKVFFPNIKLNLLDSNNKKTTFLKEVINKLDLKDVLVINKRAEDYIKEERESFDVVTSRAVAETRILCELSLPFIKNNGYLILMKASDEVTQKELSSSSKTINILCSKLENVISFNLPIEDSRRNLVVIKKINNIEKIYPRTYDKILKKPLK